MSYGIVRIQKFKATAVTGIRIHDNREKEISHTNPDINREKSGENYSLQASESFNRDVKQRIDALELKKAPRKDAVVMCQALITSDREFFDQLTSEQEKQFFKDAFEFIKSRYGSENIISATVHKDEKTPHMHVNFVPATADGRLSAKSLLTRGSLRELQNEFCKLVGAKYGLKRGESLENKRKHLETEEYKQKTKKDEIERFKAAIKPYINLEKGMAKAESHGKMILPGVVAIKQQSLETLKEQAKAYMVNRGALANLRKREQNVLERERLANQQEQYLNSKEKELSIKQQNVNEMYQRQALINQALVQTEKERENLKKQLETQQLVKKALYSQNADLKAKLEAGHKAAVGSLNADKKDLTERLRGAYERVVAIVKAVGMLKHDDPSRYGSYRVENLTEKQAVLIESIAKYGAHWAEQEKFHDLAQSMETQVGITNGIQTIVKSLERNRDFSRGR